MLAGTLYALAAGLMWGLVFVAPAMLPEYPAALLALGRYLAFGLIVLPLAWLDRRRLAELTRADWRDATALTLIGNFLYYGLLAAGIQRAGTPLATMIIGTLPVVIAIASNRRNAARDGLIAWRSLAPSLLLIALGIALVNRDEIAHLRESGGHLADFALGALLTIGAVACWTWYPIRNADWMRAHPGRPSSTWATAQGLVTLPIAVLGYALFWAAQAAGLMPALAGFDMPLRPRPLGFAGLMFAIGLFASRLGTPCWNQASARLPCTLVGQLIVFETLSALLYAFIWRGQAPGVATLAGIALLVAGVLLALRARPRAPAHA